MGDRDRPAPDVRGALATALPDYRVESVTLLGEGTDNTAFEINGELIVRFGRAPDPQRTDREARLLTVVSGLATLPVPEPVFTLPALGCLAYRKLPGTPLLDLPRPHRAETIVAALEGFLTVLHAVPPEQVDGLVDTDVQPLTRWRDEAAELYPAVAGHIPAPYRGRVEAFLGATPPQDGSTLVFCHNDLGAEHVLVDPLTWAVTGVIDWSDAALTDPARDHGLLLRDLGPAAPPPGGDGLRERAVFYARCGLLEDLAYGLRTGRPRYAGRSLAALAWLFADDRVPADRARDDDRVHHDRVRDDQVRDDQVRDGDRGRHDRVRGGGS